MKTGTLILMTNSSDAEKKVAERLRDYSLSKGRKDVFIGSHTGEPDCYKVFLGMYSRGIDTFCILPLSIAEGSQTVWNMPKHLTLPDNSGSWTMIGEHDVATRFSTALGREPKIGFAMERELGSVDKETGIVVAAYGSKLSMSEKTAEYYAEYLRYLGWNAITGFTRYGPRTLKEACAELRSKGCNRIRIVPLFITITGISFNEALSDIDGEYSIEKPVSEYPEFYEILDSKIPEEW